MAIVDMIPINDKISKDFSYEYAETLSAAGNGNTVLLPNRKGLLTLTLSFTGTAEGTIQTSTDTIARIENGDIVWLDAWFGPFDATVNFFVFTCSAIRVVMTGGAGTVTMTARKD